MFLPQGVRSAGTNLLVYQLHGQPASGVLRRRPFPVHFQAAVHIRGHPGVQRPIPALQDIQVPCPLLRSAHARIVADSNLNSKMIIDTFVERRYYSAMRKGVDHIGVGVGAVIFNDSGEVFLAKRGHEARNEKHRWEFPGGSVEFGETLEHALQREMNEEFGIQIEVIRLLDVVDHILTNEKQHWVSPTYLCRHRSGTPVIREPHKCEAIGWFGLDSIPDAELSIASRKSLQSLKRHLAAECQDR